VLKKYRQHTIPAVFALACFLTASGRSPTAREIVDLTVDSAVGISLEQGYRIRMLKLAVKRNRSNLKAERAALKSRVYMHLKAPEYNAVADYKWNSTLQRDEIIQTITRRWQLDFSIRQPLIIFSRPTNGYLSLNNRTYKYLQKEDAGFDVDYYNRFFLEFRQPFFLPNRLKNDIERAELNMKQEVLQDMSDKVNEVVGVSFTFFRLYELAHRDRILTLHDRSLEKILDAAKAVSLEDSSRQTDVVQVEIELVNAREMRLNNLNELNAQSMRMKQRLGLNPGDSLIVRHDISMAPVDVEYEKALEYGYTLRPRLKIMSMGTRKAEIDLNNTEGRDKFHMTLRMSLGFENNEDRYRAMWDEYDNSYSFRLFAYFPIWDWGRRRANIEAARISVKRSELYHDEIRDTITNDITTAVANLHDYRRRVERMRKNLDDALKTYELSIGRYRERKMSIQGVLTALDRRKNLELNFLEAYLGYRRSLLMLTARTFYDFESGRSLMEKYGL